jgi:hypothetical protein
MIEKHTPKIPLQKFGELRLAAPIEKGRPAYLAAASGLVRHREHCFVVADDELHLGIFAASDLRPSEPMRLLPGNLPENPKQRKKAKADFEVLALLPPAAEIPHGAVLAMGSGSRAGRNQALMLPLSDTGLPRREHSQQVDFSDLFATLAREFGVVNIEGAVLQQDKFLLLQRGNKGHLANAIVQLDYAELLRELWRGEIGANALRTIANYSLGVLSDVPLGFSDATCLPDGRLLALAVAEDTDDAYVDGVTTGSCLCVFDRSNILQRMLPLDVPAKTEGLAVWSKAEKTLALVTDADSVEIPAALYLLNCSGPALDDLL